MLTGDTQVTIAASAAVLVLLLGAVAMWRRRGGSPIEQGALFGASGAALSTAPGESAPPAVAHRPPPAAPVATGAGAIVSRLEPVAHAVGAKGIIVWWIARHAGGLEVLAGYGYDGAFLAQLQPVGLDDPGLIAAACRERRVSTRPVEGEAYASVAAPMLRDDALVGVVLAELPSTGSPGVSADVQRRVQALANDLAPLVPAQAGDEPLPAARVPPREPPSGSAASPLHEPVAVAQPPAAPSAVAAVHDVSAPTPGESRPDARTAGDDDESALRDARSRFIAGFRKRSANIDELIGEVESKGTDGPLPALKQIVHRLSSVAVVVGLPGVGARASELDTLLDSPQAAANIAGVRRAFVKLQEAFGADLAAVPPLWAAPSGAAVGAHVAVITSDGALAERAVQDLRHAAYRVTFVADGQRAISVAQNDRPGVMLVDVDLKGDLDGHGVCRRIKTDPALASIPVVLLAAQASTLDRMAGFALGADDYLNKPLQVVEMLLRVRWMLTRPASERKPAPRAGGGLLTAETFLAAARDVLRSQPAALGLVRVTPGTMTTGLAALFSDDLRRKDLLGSYSDSRLAVMLPGATAGVAARRILGVLDAARAAELAPTCAGVTATGINPARYIEPLVAEAEAAVSSAQAQGLPIIIYGAGTEAPRGTVLIVDDDAEVVHIIDARLKAAGLQTMVAFDGQEALQRAETAKPAVVVLELALPKRSGFDVLAQLRAMPEPRPKVIVVSSRSREEDVVRAFDLGADDYLTKPFNPQELLARTSRLLK